MKYGNIKVRQLGSVINGDRILFLVKDIYNCSFELFKRVYMM